MKRGLIVSCQALPGEPLHSSFIMGRMAVAAQEGGAVGIRANSCADIEEIKKNANLPIIGIIKKEYPNITPYITPTLSEVDQLVAVGVEIIAVDATFDQNEDYLKQLKQRYPGQQFMADISTFEEGERACRLGFDYVGTTLVGYTSRSKDTDRFQVVRQLVALGSCKVIAEGNFSTPADAADALKLGAYAVVVGGAITRPQLITKTFANAVAQVLETE